MKVILTGATGFIGQQLVPFLAGKGHELLLLGRDKDRMSALFPDIANMTYEEMLGRFDGYETLIHLAVQNNDSDVELGEFRKVNLGLLKDIVSASAGHLKRIINFSTIQLNDRAKSSYTITKQEAETFLNQQNEIATVIMLRLAAVYGESFRGKMSFLNSAPPFLLKIIKPMICSLRPTVHIDKVLSVVEQNLLADESQTLLVTDDQARNWFYVWAKRLMDITLSVSALVFVGWLFPFIALAIKYTSPGPVLFIQRRVGKNGKIFKCIKFRTMFVNTEQAGTHEVAQSSITGVGHVLRKTHFDELPQVWNVLKNEMSFVGPRPSLPSQEELIAERNARDVLSVLPGITGLSQVKGINMSTPVLLAESDESYLKTRSLILDVVIILKTFLRIG